MKVNILASGSSGNCIAIQSKDSCILIDAGVPKTKIEKRLLDVGIRADEIKAIFITHAHADHTKGLALANKYSIPVYASDGEWKGISGVNDDYKRNIPTTFGDYDLIEMDDFQIKSFSTHHDAFEPLGFVIKFEHKKVSICLDTGHVDSRMLRAMKNSDIYIIEANHEASMVENSSYPNSVKARILSDVGHLSNEQTAKALSKLVKGKGEQIYLTHLSSNNNLPALAEITVKSALAKKGLKAGVNYEVEVV